MNREGDVFDREKDLFTAFAAGRLSRRELLGATARLGLATAAASRLLGAATTSALAADFDWQTHKGTALKLLLNRHPYTDALIADLDSFRNLTGIAVSYDVLPEDMYFDKLTEVLQAKSDSYDAFMTGAYMTWTYGPAGWLEDLAPYIADPARTNPRYAWDDILPGLRASTAWNGVAGTPLGSADAKQWCLPWAYEMPSLTYNKVLYDRMGLQPPADMEGLIETTARFQQQAGGPYGIGVRGSRSWATIHAGFLSAYANFGLKDFTVADGRLAPAMNTKESKAFHASWVKLVQGAGPPKPATCSWYKVGSDLGSGASGMIYDADIIGYFANGGENKEAGNLGFHAFTPNPAAKAPTPNVWIWSLALSRFSRNKDAAWLWMQWASSLEHGLFGARKMDFINPVRKTVADDAEWHGRIAQHYPGYLDQLAASSPGAKIYFTAQPLFFDVTTDWATSLQKMVTGQVPVDEELDRLAKALQGRLKEAGIG